MLYNKRWGTPEEAPELTEYLAESVLQITVTADWKNGSNFLVLKTFFYLWCLVNCFLELQIANILLSSLTSNRLTGLLKSTIEVYAILVD